MVIISGGLVWKIWFAFSYLNSIVSHAELRSRGAPYKKGALIHKLIIENPNQFGNRFNHVPVLHKIFQLLLLTHEKLQLILTILHFYNPFYLSVKDFIHERTTFTRVAIEQHHNPRFKIITMREIASQISTSGIWICCGGYKFL